MLLAETVSGGVIRFDCQPQFFAILLGLTPQFVFSIFAPWQLVPELLPLCDPRFCSLSPRICLIVASFFSLLHSC
jgi:hypothetical protein